MSGGSIGVIADDFTGATDVAAAFRRAGLETLLFFDTPSDARQTLPKHDALVIALKTRSVAASVATKSSLRAAEWLTRHGANQLYFKYCSTFDSTPQGNIGPVLDALSQRVGANVVVTTPASPEHGRTVYNGYLFVGESLLSESSMRSHPLNPMTDSNLPRLLAEQSAHEVGLLSHATQAGGVPAIERVIAGATRDAQRYLVADALDDSGLATLAECLRDAPLVAGAAGLAGALGAVRAHVEAAAQEDSDETSSSRVDRVESPLRAAILAGSCSRQTLRQIDLHRASGQPGYRIDPMNGRESSVLARDALAWFDNQASDTTALIYTSLAHDELRVVQDTLGVAESATLLEAALAEVATGLVDRGIRRIIVAGGETSGAIVAALGLSGVRVGDEAARGVPWIYGMEEPALALLLKSGNFGDDDFFVRNATPQGTSNERQSA